MVRQALAQVFESGVPARFESLSLNERGEYRWFATRVGPVRQEEAVVGLTMIATDISARREMELALESERDFAQLIITNMGQGLTLTDSEGKLQYANPAYSAITGYTSDEIVGKAPFDLAPPEAISHLQRQKINRQSGKTTAYESFLKHKDGRHIPVLITGVPRWQDGQIIGAIAVVTDPTEQKEAAGERERLIMELEARNAELERFTYTVSHDLKSPLVTIKGFLGLLERDLAADDKPGMRQAMARIHYAAKTMETLLADLLELSRVGRLINPPETVSFVHIVAEALSLVDGYLEDRAVTIQVAPDLPDVFVDRARLVEVMQNLLDNALKFTQGQPEAFIEVGTERRGDDLLFFCARQWLWY
ncbi:MAG: PAS domain S-box protein [Chloroflexi bacterium]|nr:PAS domain S-box protein [Chloroflexota bacterium]